MSKVFLKELAHDAHKYSHGTVGVIAGSRAYSGGAVLCVGGARRGGSGYITYLSQDRLPTLLVLSAYPDVVVRKKISEISVDAWVIGSGSPKLRRNFQIPSSRFAVLDANAMTLSPQINAEVVVITPHHGEAEKLGFPVGANKSSRINAALKLAKHFEAYVLLKGEETVIASPYGAHLTNAVGGPELATAGTGDVLAGLLGSLLASWRPETDSEIMAVIDKAVNMHGLAGKLANSKISPITATDLLKTLGKVER